MLHILWALAGVVVVWFAGKFFGVPLIEIMVLRRQVHQGLMISSKVKLKNKDWYLHQEVLDNMRRDIGEFGSRLAALNTSLYQPLSFILEKLRYDLDGAAANLLHLSIELDEGERSLTRRRVEIALRLPTSTESHECGPKATQGSSRLNGHHHDVGVLPPSTAHGTRRIGEAYPGDTAVDSERADSNKRLRRSRGW
jgi:hypothetical protein